jgi:demethylmenaquinone methyltransferase / 2-methoxy-6-polyprenyl-1,4-benzoquinol methylase
LLDEKRRNHHLKPFGQSQKRPDVKSMFDRLSDHYDLLNRMMTFGFDSIWRRRVIEKAHLPPGGYMLDVGAGTGDIAFTALQKNPTVTVTAADFSFGMMKKGRSRPGGHQIPWCSADALQLPFANGIFDAVTSGYLIRNVVNPLRAFQEQFRVLKPGGRVVCLETSPPKRNLLRPLIVLHLKVTIPFLGRLVGGNREAYTYLPDTTRRFMNPHEMVATMQEAGFESIAYELRMFGTMTIHTGRRPEMS